MAILKAEIKNILKNLTNKNFERNLPVLKEFFKTRTNYTLSTGMTEEYIHPSAFDSFSRDQLSELNKLGNISEDETNKITNKQKMNEYIWECARSIISENFLTRMRRGKIIYYEILNTEKKILKELSCGKHEFLDLIQNLYVLNLEKDVDGNPIYSILGMGDDAIYEAFMFRSIIANVVHEVKRLDESVEIWTNDLTKWSFSKPLILPDKNKSFPLIKIFLDRLCDGNLLAAWIYGCYTGDYKGRRVPYITGVAETKKSIYISSVCEGLFGNAFQSISAKKAAGDDKFMMSQFVNAKMVNIPDNSNRKLILTEWAKQLTGGDKIAYEFKNQTPDSGYLETNLIVMSNVIPSFSRDKSATSRILPMFIQEEKDDVYVADLGKKIIEELPGFLAHAREQYELLCTDNYFLKFNDKVAENMEQCIRDFEAMYVEILNEGYVLCSQHNSITYGNFLEILDFCKKTKNRKGKYFDDNFETWLLVHKGVTISFDKETLIKRFNGLADKEGPAITPIDKGKKTSTDKKDTKTRKDFLS